MRLEGYYSTATAAFHATERGKQREPSTTMLAKHSLGNETMLVGMGDGFLSYGMVKPVLGVLWQGGGGAILPIEHDMELFTTSHDLFLGITSLEGVTEAEAVMRLYPSGKKEAGVFETMTMVVDENGYFYGQLESPVSVETAVDMVYLVGLDKEGKILYAWGEKP